MNEHDPMRVVYDAIERAGGEPEGPEYRFRAYCPVHRGDAKCLCVNEGADGRVVMWCHAHQCAYRDVMNAIGLSESDGFPDGHHLASMDRCERSRTAAEALVESLEAIGIWVRATDSQDWWLAAGCPACGISETLWIKGIGRSRVRLSCWSGCTTSDIRAAITCKAVGR
jgi:hypothetical protein